MQLGYVELLQIQRERGLPFERVMSIELVEGMGIVGDCHAKGGDKQVAILSNEAKQEIETQELSGLCYQKFQENIVIEGMKFDLLKERDHLIVDDVIVELSSYAKRCFPECLLRQRGEECQLKSQIVFGKVVHSGMIRIGDKIEHKENHSEKSDMIE